MTKDLSLPTTTTKIIQMIDYLLLPFSYQYMFNAISISVLVGGICAFLSAFLILKGWSLIGDALSHSIVPGVAGAYILGIPFSLGAFAAGGLAAGSIILLQKYSGLKEDTIIGLTFTSFFGLGLFMASLWPLSVNVKTITMGNVLAISDEDIIQILIIGFVTLFILIWKWKDIMVAFFDENHARSIGLNPHFLKGIFFVLLSATCVAALQTVGAFLVIAMIITPGATAYLLTDRFSRVVMLSIIIGVFSSFIGSYLSFFLDGATGALIVLIQTLIFILTFIFAPKYGYLKTLKSRNSLK